MNKDMVTAPINHQHNPVGRLSGTGIKLKVTDRKTGLSVNYGIQLNNTTLEIEALPNLKVEVEGKDERKD